MAASKPSKIKTFFACISFFTVFTEVKILAKFVFLSFYRLIFVMFISVGMCEIILIAGGSINCGFSATIFIELSKFLMKC